MENPLFQDLESQSGLTIHRLQIHDRNWISEIALDVVAITNHEHIRRHLIKLKEGLDQSTMLQRKHERQRT